MVVGLAPIRWRHGVAFALLELLVALAIVIILCALLLPKAKDMVDQARTASCLHNLKQLGMACQTYAIENDGRLPTSTSNTWRIRVAPYLGITPSSAGEELYGASFKDVRVFTCPFIAKDGTPRRSYGINTKIQQGGKVDGYREAMSIWVQVPSKTMLLADALNTSFISALNQISYRHSNTNCGIFFLDGHVENSSSNQVSSLNAQAFFGGQN